MTNLGPRMRHSRTHRIWKEPQGKKGFRTNFRALNYPLGTISARASFLPLIPRAKQVKSLILKILALCLLKMLLLPVSNWDQGGGFRRWTNSALYIGLLGKERRTRVNSRMNSIGAPLPSMRTRPDFFASATEILHFTIITEFLIDDF